MQNRRLALALSLFTLTSACADLPTQSEPSLQPHVSQNALSASDAAEIFAEGNLVSGDSRISGRYPDDLLLIHFADGTTAAQRDAAADSVAAEIIASTSYGSADNSVYYFRLNDQADADTLFAARGELQSLPEVEWADPDISLGYGEAYVLPDDGDDWRTTDWTPSNEAANGENWGLEYVQAPLAWGCSVGSSDVKMAVVDSWFQDVDDLDNNIVVDSSFTLMGDYAYSGHGSVVASILTAEGGNGTGMAGMMWESQTALYNYYSREQNYVESLYDAVLDSPDIINMSLALRWLQEESLQRPPSASNPEDLERAAASERTFRLMLESVVEQAPKVPLFIVAAGNDGVDASWNGAARVLDDPALSGYVLFVAATDQADNLWQLSNRNAGNQLVEVAAPGVDIYGISGLDSIPEPYTGTSVATPIVAGIAGLLKAFDPSLTPPQIKDLIVDGAVASGNTAGGIPIVDAYESLKLASRTAGAPLCGSRLWMDGGTVYTERDGFDEALAQRPTTSGDTLVSWRWVNALHGGRNFGIREVTTVPSFPVSSTSTDTLWYEYDESSRDWDSVGEPSIVADSTGGTYLSSLSLTHDIGYEIWSVVDRFESPSTTGWVRFWRHDFASDVSEVLDSIAYTTPSIPIESICVRQRESTGYCFEEVQTFHDQEVISQPAANPITEGGDLTLALKYYAIADSTAWTECDIDILCRTIDFEEEIIKSTAYRYVSSSGLTVAEDNLSGANLWMGISEDSREVISLNATTTSTYRCEGSEDDVSCQFVAFGLADCDIQFRDFESYSMLRTISVACADVSKNPTGTISPFKGSQQRDGPARPLSVRSPSAGSKGGAVPSRH